MSIASTPFAAGCTAATPQAKRFAAKFIRLMRMRRCIDARLHAMVACLEEISSASEDIVVDQRTPSGGARGVRRADGGLLQ